MSFPHCSCHPKLPYVILSFSSVILSVAKDLASSDTDTRFFASLRMTSHAQDTVRPAKRQTQLFHQHHAAVLCGGTAVESHRARATRSLGFPTVILSFSSVILSVAKDLASSDTDTGFFATLRMTRWKLRRPSIHPPKTNRPRIAGPGVTIKIWTAWWVMAPYRRYCCRFHWQ